MEKKLFLRLIKEIKTGDLIFKMEEITRCNSHNLIEELFKLRDNEIEDFISIKDVKLKIAKLYLYIKHSELSVDIIDEIEKNIQKGNINIYHTLKTIEHFNLIGRKDTIKFVKAIANSSSEYQARCASEVAIDQTFSNRDDAIRFVELIANTSKIHQAEYAKEVALNTNVLKNKCAINLLKLIAETSFEYQAKYATFVAIDLNVLNNKNCYEIVKVISNSQKDYQAKYATFVALNEFLIEKDNILEIINNVSLAKSSEEAKKMACFIEESFRPKTTKKQEKIEVKENLVIEEQKIVDFINSVNITDFTKIINDLESDTITLDTKVKVLTKNKFNIK